MINSPSQAPDCTLPALDASSVSLKDLWAAGPVLLIFFKVSCPTCQLTFPFLERIHQGNRGAKLVAISQDSAMHTEEFRRKFGITIPMLLDVGPRYAAAEAYEISSVPSLFGISQEGSIGWSDAGFDRAGLAELGRQAGVEVFAKDEHVPAFQAG